LDRVGDDLVAVRIRDRVPDQVDGAMDCVADEAVPETVVAALGVAPVDDAVLDRVPGNVERAAERAGTAVDVDTAVDRAEVDLHIHRVRRVDATVDGRSVPGVLL